MIEVFEMKKNYGGVHNYNNLFTFDTQSRSRWHKLHLKTDNIIIIAIWECYERVSLLVMRALLTVFLLYYLSNLDMGQMIPCCLISCHSMMHTS